MGRELRYLKHKILSYPKERKALLLHYCHSAEKFTLLHRIVRVTLMHTTIRLDFRLPARSR